MYRTQIKMGLARKNNLMTWRVQSSGNVIGGQVEASSCGDFSCGRERGGEVCAYTGFESRCLHHIEQFKMSFIRNPAKATGGVFFFGASTERLELQVSVSRVTYAANAY
jgi:hypothetical protein